MYLNIIYLPAHIVLSQNSPKTRCCQPVFDSVVALLPSPENQAKVNTLNEKEQYSTYKMSLFHVEIRIIYYLRISGTF